MATSVPSSDFPKPSVKGRLFRSMELWKSIGTLDFILDVIKEGYKIPFICTPPTKHYSNNASALREADFVDQAIAEFLAARFPHRSLLHYAYGPLFQENNSDNNRRPLGV